MASNVGSLLTTNSPRTQIDTDDHLSKEAPLIDEDVEMLDDGQVHPQVQIEGLGDDTSNAE